MGSDDPESDLFIPITPKRKPAPPAASPTRPTAPKPAPPSPSPPAPPSPPPTQQPRGPSVAPRGRTPLLILAILAAVATLLAAGADDLIRRAADSALGARTWVSDRFASRDERAWRQASRAGFERVEWFLKAYPDSTRTGAARAELVRLAPTLPVIPASGRVRVKIRARLRAAPSVFATEMTALPGGAAIRPSGTVRAGAWYVLRWAGAPAYSAARLFTKAGEARPRPMRRRRVSSVRVAPARPPAPLEQPYLPTIGRSIEGEPEPMRAPSDEQQ